jgi:hypothetical protein
MGRPFYLIPPNDHFHQKILSVSCSSLYIIFIVFVLVFRGSLILY